MGLSVAHRIGLAPTLPARTGSVVATRAHSARVLSLALEVVVACASREVLTGEPPELGELVEFFAARDVVSHRLHWLLGIARGEGWLTVGGLTVTSTGWSEVGVPAPGGAENRTEREVG